MGFFCSGFWAETLLNSYRLSAIGYQKKIGPYLGIAMLFYLIAALLSGIHRGVHGCSSSDHPTD
jgi:hypothetical protein